MRGKRVKQIRRIAEAATVGNPATRYKRTRWGVEMYPLCTRAVAKEIKKKYKSGVKIEINPSNKE